MEKLTYGEYEQMTLKPFVEGMTDENLKISVEGIKGIKNHYNTDISVQFIYSLIGGTGSVNRVKMSRYLKRTKPTLTDIKRTLRLHTLTNIVKVNEILKFISFN